MNRTTFIEIVGCIGEDKALKLITDFSGRNIFIPLLSPGRSGRSKTRNQILDSIGIEAMENLMASHGGKQAYIPNGYKEVRQARGRKIAKEYDGSETLAEIAIKHGLSSRRIWEILKNNGISPRKLKKEETLSRYGKVAKLYNGENIRVLANKLGVSTGMVTRALRKTGKLPPLEALQIRKIKRLERLKTIFNRYKSGTLKEYAKSIGINYGIVIYANRVLRSEGITIP